MKYRFALVLAAFALLGVAHAGENPMTATMVNPMEMVGDVDAKLRGSGLYRAILGLASAIAVSGFFVKLYAALGRNNSREMRGVIVQGIGVALMMSMSANIHEGLTSTWNSTYNSSNAIFAGSLTTKIEEAKGHMIEMAGTVATVASLGSAGAAAGAASKAAVMGETVLPKAIEAGAGVAAKASSRIASSSIALSGFVVMYSGIIAIAAFIIMLLGYLMPFVISLTMWGQTGPIWTAVGSALGAIIITGMMPLLAYSAIDHAFVRPAQASADFMANSGIGERLKSSNQQLADTFSASLTAQAKECAEAQKKDAKVICTSADQRSMIQKAYESVKTALANATTVFENALLQVANYIGVSLMQVIFAVLFFIVALAIMGALVNFIVGVLGGAASYVGAVAKGGG